MGNIASRVREAFIGEFLAGLFTIETFFLGPCLFDDYISVSPSLWWEEMEYGRRESEFLRSEEYTSELQSLNNFVCRLLLATNKTITTTKKKTDQSTRDLSEQDYI